jgi:hypothetical protein
MWLQILEQFQQVSIEASRVTKTEALNRRFLREKGSANEPPNRSDP